jgi:predicted ArsR family transcriptional regulator
MIKTTSSLYIWDYKYKDDKRSELGVQSIAEILDIYRTNCHDHLLRIEPYRVPPQVYRYRPTGRRNVGRPKKRWKEQFYKNPGGGTDQLAQAFKLLMTMK